MVLGLAVAVSLTCVYDFRICLLWLSINKRIFLYHHATTTYNDSSKRPSNFSAECAGKPTSFSTPTQHRAIKKPTASNLPRTHPPIEELKDFEDDMLKMIQSVKFKQVNNPFLNKLKEDTDSIQTEPKLLIAADKTTNFYKLEPSEYNDLLEKNITKSYKKAQPETTQAIHKQNKDIATKLGIDDRVDTTANKDAFITLKDHKPNFTNKPTCRLINPTKSEIGKVSKGILDRINSNITKTRNFNQWKNTAAVKRIRVLCKRITHP